MENLVSLTGEVKFADRLEKVAFNALPAAITPDFWGHQYDEQSNQVACVSDPRARLTPPTGATPTSSGWSPSSDAAWPTSTRAGPSSPPTSGCPPPTAVWPPSPTRPAWWKPKIGGNPVKMELVTDYPFSENLTFNVTAQQPFEFPLYLRVPEWCKEATVKMPDGMVQKLDSGKYNRILRKWSGSEAIILYLPMNFKVTKGYNDSLSIQRGPLVYSLGLKEQWRVFMPFKQQPPGMKKNDYMVLPQTHWNYALVFGPGPSGPVSDLWAGNPQREPLHSGGSTLPCHGSGKKLRLGRGPMGPCFLPRKVPLRPPARPRPWCWFPTARPS